MAEMMQGMKRTDYCGTLRAADCGRTVTVCGWAQRQRDLGGLIFIDLRDRSGIVQLAFDDATERDVFEKAAAVRSEFVLGAVGVVRERSNKNAELPTGDVEIEVKKLRVFAKSETTPFEIIENTNAKEDLRLKYRYLDLRRAALQHNLRVRHQVANVAHDYFDRNGFLEIETPYLSKSTPEGARDYLVPSRVFPGRFFALPQSPQQYKQLLMIAGIDRYMQIVRCFRDEDLRADRQPEFTQIDFEMSFADQEDVMAVAEGFVREVFRRVLGTEFEAPLPRLTWDEAMRRFGSDKPDVRFGMELQDLAPALQNTEFRVFQGALAAGGSVRGINLKGRAGELTRKEIDKLAEWVKAYGAKGLAWTRLADSETSSYEKFLTPQEAAAVRTALAAQPGDVLFLVASDEPGVVYASLGALRVELARRFGLIDTNRHAPLWITDFPEFEYSKEENRWVAMHHPFTAPRDEDIDKLKTDPAHVYAKAYDLVIDGYEMGSGSIRIHDPEMQEKMFEALGFTPESARERFGYFIEAFRYGAPPHGGMALGLERLVMVLLGTSNIRDVVAFPKVASSADLMMEAPGDVDEAQLTQLGLLVRGEQTPAGTD